MSSHVRQQLDAEQLDKEQQRKEKEESHLHTVIKVARDKDLQAQIGNDLYFDLVDHEKVLSLLMLWITPYRVSDVICLHML